MMLLLQMVPVLLLMLALCISTTDGQTKEMPCSKLLRNTPLPCLCSLDDSNGTVINCDSVSFAKDFPVLPHRHRIHSFSQRSAGIQSLEAQLFTASDIPLKSVDFSDNILRRITERVFDGIEDTLEEIYLGKNKLGDQLNPVFSTSEFRRLGNLLILDLSANELKALQSDIFTGLTSLQMLHLEDNELDEIPAPSLKGLEALKTLNLQGNNIDEVSQTTFPELLQLSMLNLSNNDISTIHNQAFLNLKSLKTLFLANNRIRSLTPDAFDGLSSLETLDLSQNFIEAVPMTSLSKTPFLKRLVLHSNKIKSLDGIHMSELKALTYIDLSRNRIYGISPNTFVGVTSLKEIRLDINSVRKVTDRMFFGLEGLSDLSLNDNRILTFPTEALTGFRMLRKLSLDYNRVAAVSSEILTPVKKLEELSLAFNLISEIPDGTFREFDNLLLLNLHGNKIVDFSASKTEGIENTLLYLDIGYNEMTILPKLKFPKLLILSLARNRIARISRETFRELTEVRYLNLSYNSLDEISPTVFESMSNLESLDVQHNLLSQIADGTFRNLSLKHVNLRFNRLTEIPEKTFHNLPKLEVVDLSENNIQTIATSAFDGVPNIKVLNLRNNKLSMFRGDIFSNETEINKLDLSYNDITYLYPNSFSVHPKLRDLDLSYNGLTFFPGEIINPIHSLQSINLEGNKLQSVGDGYFSNMPNLRSVYLQNNEITLIGESAFQNSSHLYRIQLQNNKISFMAEKAFNGLSRLQLDLNGNRLNSLPNEIFSRTNGLKLETINLAHNEFREFPTSALKRQYSFLEKANFSSNRIITLPSNADVLVNIKDLDLSNNPLSAEAHHVLFAEPKSVRLLNVASTGVTTLPLIESPFLKVLNLSGNRISGMNSETFQRASMLCELDLSFNEIPNLSVNMAPAWNKLPHLRHLDLSSNPIRYITQSDFNHLSNLRELKISNLSYVSEMECDGLRNLPKLRRLFMFGYHSLRYLDSKQCLQFLMGLERLSIEIKEAHLKDQLQAVYSPRLSDVTVSGRSLSSLSSSAFAGMLSPSIRISLMGTSVSSFSDKLFLPLPLSSKIHLSLSNNRLRRLSPELLSALDNKQMSVDLKGLESNPITCDCNVHPFWRWIQDKISSNSIDRQPGIASILNVECLEPSNLRGRKVSSATPEDLTCGDTTAATTTTTTALPPPPSTSRWPSTHHNDNDIIFEPPVTKRPPIHSSVPTRTGSRNSLTKVDTMIIGIVAGVVAFVCILIIIICIVRLRRARPHYTAGPLAGPLAFRAQGKCTCLKPPPNSCTCYPMYPVSVPYPTLGPPGSSPHHKMLPPPLPPPPALLNTMGRQGRPKNTPYYVTYPDSDNDNR